ncbi:hypothetical protein G7Y41_09305 [Schaalia sp. ZJ405]|uniref:hypothetical protein n=1 Tax=Schaalia sp. ZJ405 TaxID=2709403 RepID=UPI0013EA8467|nr:hypothetical protein [Schaalia sp. ZJ405]QPK81211.1 hypothetical protein G7Y41_09305 [Schaalia sp. ZJ405]
MLDEMVEYRKLYNDLRVYAVQVPDPYDNVVMSDQGYDMDPGDAFVGLIYPLIDGDVILPDELMDRLRAEIPEDPYWAPQFRRLEKAQKKLRRKATSVA